MKVGQPFQVRDPRYNMYTATTRVLLIYSRIVCYFYHDGNSNVMNL